MAHLFNNQPDDAGYQTPPEAPQPEQKRWVKTAIVAALLAVIGSSSAVLWHSYGGMFPAMPSFASVAAPSATPAAANLDKPVALKDFQAFQQQIAGPMQSTAQLLAAQQAETKRLSDQIAALAAKIDLLERAAVAAQAASPARSPQPVSQSTSPRKRPALRKPADSISVGGAPLPPPVQLSR